VHSQLGIQFSIGYSILNWVFNSQLGIKFSIGYSIINWVFKSQFGIQVYYSNADQPLGKKTFFDNRHEHNEGSYKMSLFGLLLNFYKHYFYSHSVN